MWHFCTAVTLLMQLLHVRSPMRPAARSLALALLVAHGTLLGLGVGVLGNSWRCLAVKQLPRSHPATAAQAACPAGAQPHWRTATSS